MAVLVFNQRERIGAWVAKKVGQTADWGSFYAMGAEEGGEIVAGIVMNNMNGANATTHIAVERTGKYLPRLLSAFADYAFRQCGLKRLTGMVPTNEPSIIEFDKHVGFEEEFVMRDGAPGADMMVMVLRPETCRWLRKE